MGDPSREERAMKRGPIADSELFLARLPDCEPSEVELEEEFDTPGLSLEQVRERFLRPFRGEQRQES